MIDSFGREITYLRLSVTDLCNLRCRYCMPEDGVCKKRHDQILTEEELVMAAEAAASLGIRKIRITGGEPLVKKNILSICRRVARVEGVEELCLTTNGVLLPALAKPLRQAGVRRVNISLDTLDPVVFRFVTGRPGLEQAMAGLEAALSAGYDRVKVNTVLLGGVNDGEIPALANLTRQYPVDVRFIEWMPMYDRGDFGPETAIPCTRVTEVLPQLQEAGCDGVARYYTLPGAKGRIGLINPVSRHFCGTCSRIRITADGFVKPCLHSPQERSIKGLEKGAMTEVLRQAILEKPACHGELSCTHPSMAGRTMNQIGG